MLIYYDATTTDRYREVKSFGGDGAPRQGQAIASGVTRPIAVERKKDLLFDTVTATLVAKADIVTEKMRKEARDYIIGISKGIFFFVPEAEREAAATFVKNKITALETATAYSQIVTIVGQVQAQINNILDTL